VSERWQAATLGFALPGMVLAMTLTWTLAAWDDTSKPTTTRQLDAQREPTKPSASASATRPNSQHLELAWQIGFSPIRLERFPLEGETLTSVRHLDSLPQVAQLPDAVQAESARRFNSVLRSLDASTPEKLDASVDRAIAETRDLRQPYRAALMFNVTMVALEQLSHAHVVKVGFDGRAFEQMKFKAARAGLTEVDSVPIGLVLRLLELASWSQLALDTEGVATWPAERRRMAELWLSQMARLGRIVDPSWDDKDLPRLNVEAPDGLPSGAAPDAVRDAKARAEYVARVEANRRKAERYNEQLLARRLLAELSPQMEELLVRLYVRRPFDTRELDALMGASSVAAERKVRITRTVKLVNNLLPAGTPLKYGWPDALAETGPDRVAQLVAAVSDTSYPNFIRHDGAWALGLIGDPRG
ncbi:MAG TPA: hypothetical protein PLV92_26275, partial [Pirellulaceae bacterium]|nr:hypothetical protein [Pirellulaceae bacterium]